MDAAPLSALIPSALGLWPAAFLVAASLATSATTAAFGLGGGLSLLALMSFYLPVEVLIPVHGIVQLGSNVGRVVVQREAVAWWTVPPYFVGAAAGALVGAQFVVALPEAVLRTVLGVFILLITFVPIPRLGALDRRGFAVAGLATTLISMFFGATGPIGAAVFSQTFRNRMTLVGTLAATTVIQHSVKILAFAILGVALLPWLPLAGAMILTGFLGTVIGTNVLKRMDERVFRVALKAILAAIALQMLWSGVGALL